EDGIRDKLVTGVQTCALPISPAAPRAQPPAARSCADHGAAGAARGGRWRARSPGSRGGSFDQGQERHLDVVGTGAIEQRLPRLRSEERRVGKGGRAGWTTDRT